MVSARCHRPHIWKWAIVRKVDMLDGVTILRSEKVEEEIVLDGTDIELVSRSAALINQRATLAALQFVERCAACLDASAHPIIGHLIQNGSLIWRMPRLTRRTPFCTSAITQGLPSIFSRCLFMSYLCFSSIGSYCKQVYSRLTPGEARPMSSELLLLPPDAPAAKPPLIPSTATTTTLATAADGTTTISSLGQDQLLEIFLRLPSLPALVRAMLTCRSWLGVVRSFRNLFRALHPAPLIRIFLDVDEGNVCLFVNKDITLAD
ncbi:unnamed protein product [Triticum turgidum subsp. durum]|uniref:F-box domain-containing protein n=1 Tax=Triticum turgidum subsp. durum TaxID=4567 RepID=A0A9R1QSB0_TRITD|nr:unnamed protein product [Triticum turgidum subsp. durum]